jgi:hypothetical protein
MITNTHKVLMLVTYAANILVAGAVGIMALFFNDFANFRLFGENDYVNNNSSFIVGSFWIAIALNSAMGLIRPLEFSAIFLIQLIYKGLFLIVRIIPLLASSGKLSQGIVGVSVFFLVWILWLPWIVP